MGIKGSNKLLYVTQNVCPLSLRQIALSRRGGDTHCRIVIDCFWLAMKLMALTGLKITPSEVGAAVAEMMIMIAKEGFIVTPVCDPPNHRHHTKQASIERVVQRENKIAMVEDVITKVNDIRRGVSSPLKNRGG